MEQTEANNGGEKYSDDVYRILLHGKEPARRCARQPCNACGLHLRAAEGGNSGEETVLITNVDNFLKM